MRNLLEKSLVLAAAAGLTTVACSRPETGQELAIPEVGAVIETLIPDGLTDGTAPAAATADPLSASVLKGFADPDDATCGLDFLCDLRKTEKRLATIKERAKEFKRECVSDAPAEFIESALPAATKYYLQCGENVGGVQDFWLGFGSKDEKSYVRENSARTGERFYLSGTAQAGPVGEVWVGRFKENRRYLAVVTLRANQEMQVKYWRPDFCQVDLLFAKGYMTLRGELKSSEGGCSEAVRCFNADTLQAADASNCVTSPSVLTVAMPKGTAQFVEYSDLAKDIAPIQSVKSFEK
jgi:hypothetical protein